MFLAATGMEAQRFAQPRRNHSCCACVVCGSARNSRRELLDSFFLCPIYATVTHMHADLQMDPAVCFGSRQAALDESLTCSEFNSHSDTDNETLLTGNLKAM